MEAGLEKQIKEIQEHLNVEFNKEFAEVLKQAVISGDFMQHVRYDDNPFSHTFGVSYVPYREVTSLKARIRELEDIISNLNSRIK